MRVEARAPTRIDLAGGTLDLYPLYLLLDGAVTVNLAISLHACVRLSPGEPASDLPELVLRPLRYFGARLRVEPSGLAPVGSGLGGSSALLLALLGALNLAVPGRVRSTRELCELAAELEAQTLGAPTGRQDYYAAAFGGLQAIWLGPGGARCERLATTIDLPGRLVLAYSGRSHASGDVNWRLLRAFVEDRGRARERFRRLRANALALRQALLSGDEAAFAAAMATDWELRRPWAGSPELTDLGERARRAGALAWKACGAGRGGCLVAFAAPGRTAELRAALGSRLLDWQPDARGLQVRLDEPAGVSGAPGG